MAHIEREILCLVHLSIISILPIIFGLVNKKSFNIKNYFTIALLFSSISFCFLTTTSFMSNIFFLD